MSAKYVKDMTEGNVVSLLVKFSLPMLIGNIFQQFYNIIDSIIVGKFVSVNAFAAVGATGSLNFLFFSVCLGMSVGIGILISQYFGAKNDEYVKRTIANSVYIIAVIGVIMSALGIILARPILEIMQTPPEIIDDAVIFMQVTSAGTIGVAAYNALASILRALGDSKTPLFFLVMACIVNVILDFIFVLGFDLEVFGVALATAISQALSALGCFIFAVRKNPYFRIEKEYRRANRELIKKCIRIGVPVAVQNSMIAISCIALQCVVNGFGKNVVGAFSATNRIEQLVQQPFNSLGVALSTFAGQNMGAGKVKRVKEGYHKSFIIIAVFSVLMLIAAQLGARYIMQLFVNDEEVITLGANALRITSYFYITLGMIHITRGLLNGVGDATYAMVNGFIEVIGRVGFAPLLVNIAFIGVWGTWLTSGLTWFITGFASFIRYKQGKWEYKSLVK
ncbi:MATE family efflux transporter [Anaeromicropila herbilytica]|uniref:Probable multidrug resistance protein NorM n=1 Tax=Anaeromicropila herbilytica TaxID=2785025 RepID=A0A7R7EKE6_9FIRM|nr:MATE family efflux transporter [Anaeromicropila herbilytica]BCN30092.1 MATE family efflux transporter [Anaeromicropila herbilytica]